MAKLRGKIKVGAFYGTRVYYTSEYKLKPTKRDR